MLRSLDMADVRPSTRENAPLAIGSQRWRDLLFVHWPVDARAVQALLPPELSVDTFEGVAYVGLIPFAMHDVRPFRRLPPIPTAAAFLETNLRTYVHRGGRDPGIWFFSLEAASLLAVVGARVGYRLPYFWSRMSMSKDGNRVQYASVRRGSGARLATNYTIGAELGTASPGTRTHFLVERYRLYTRFGRRLFAGEVRHQPYPLQRATVETLDETLVAAAGLSASAPPIEALFSPGVDVEVCAPRRAE
jgi:uncharacterized protein